MSQKEAAALLKVSDDTLRNWENGTTRPRDESLAALAEFCGLTLEELIRPEPEVQQQPAESQPTENVAVTPPQVRARPLTAWIAISVLVAIGILGGAVLTVSRRSGRFDTLRATANGFAAVSRSGRDLWQASGVDPKIAERWTLVRMPGGRTLIACVYAKPGDFRPETVRTLSLLEPNAKRATVVDRITLPMPAEELFPGYSRRYDLAYLNALDIDGDGIDEIIATFQQVPECVSYTILYEPAIRRARVLFAQTGAHHFTGAWDLDGDGRRDLLFLGINNGYNWVNTLAAVRVKPWIGKRRTDEFTVFSPDSAAYLPAESQSLFYTLLPRGRVPDDPAAVSWDPKRRLISVRLMNGLAVKLTPHGFLTPSRSTVPETHRTVFRRKAYQHDRESRRLSRAGFAADAVQESREAVIAAKRAGDDILTEAMQRGLAKALIAAERTAEAEELVTRLARKSENASEIFYDAARAFHLAGDLRRAVGYYEAGIRRGGSPESGKSKHEFIQGEVFALVELGEFDEAEQAIDRFRDRYVAEGQGAAIYREFVRWRKGELPRADLRAASPSSTDLMRYWALEFRNARGEEAGSLLLGVGVLLAEGNQPEGALLSLRAILLNRLGRTAEARSAAQQAFLAGAKGARESVTARGHLRLVSRRSENVEAGAP